MVKITPLLLYIINQVKLRRLVLGYSAEYLSFILKRSHGYVLTAEDPSIKAQYPTHEWPKLATALGCEINDLLPHGPSISTGELVEKKVLSLNEEEDVRKVLNALKEHGFFDEVDGADNHEISRLHGISLEKTLTKVVKLLNIQDEDQVALFRKVLYNYR
jgi:hypothetical protein